MQAMKAHKETPKGLEQIFISKSLLRICRELLRAW